MFCDRMIQVPNGRFGRRQHPTVEVVFHGFLCIGHEFAHEGSSSSEEDLWQPVVRSLGVEHRRIAHFRQTVLRDAFSVHPDALTREFR